jgi:hypothetical protein
MRIVLLVRRNRESDMQYVRFFCQIVSAFVVGLFYYLIVAIMTVFDGFPSYVLQPIAGSVFTLIAISMLLIVGLPIRFVTRMNRWWKRHGWIPITLGIIAFAMMIASSFPALRVQVFDPETESMIDSFNPWLGIGGWLLTIFSVLHFYPPFGWFTKWIRRVWPKVIPTLN